MNRSFFAFPGPRAVRWAVWAGFLAALGACAWLAWLLGLVASFPLRVSGLAAVAALTGGTLAWLGQGLVSRRRLAGSRAAYQQTLQALRESEERFRITALKTGELIYDYDVRSGRIVWTGAIEQLTGFTEAEFQDVGIAAWEQLLHPDDRPAVVQALERARAAASTFDVQYRIRRKNGAYSHVEDHGVFLADAQGRTARMLGTMMDVTERLRHDEERVRLERQVLQAQKLESLGVLAGGIAHDFNNLLTAILGNADLARQEIPAHLPAHERVAAIEEASRCAAELCRQMLDYSGQGGRAVEDLSLPSLIEETAHLLHVSIAGKARLQLSLRREVPRVRGDAAQLRQVIMNLITNAADSVRDGEGLITLATGVQTCDRAYLDALNIGREAAAGLFVFVEVTDNGCGMDAATLARIFDPFFTTKGSGRGLGLATVLGIVRGHRGGLKVYSEPGRGSLFKILLPALAETTPPADGPSKPSGEPWRGAGQLLVVDDEELVRKVSRAMLGEIGFTVLTAAGGREALEVFRQHGDTLRGVILDLTMPGLSSADTFRELHRLRPDVRVILSSGYPEQDVRQRFPFAGQVAGFIQKPFVLRNLGESLRAALGE